MKDLSEPNISTYHYEYDPNGNRTLVEIKDDGLTLESTVYTYDRLNKLISSREVTASGLYLYEYTYDDNGNLISEDRHRQFETQRTNIRRYEYTKDNKLESVYSGNTLLVSYTYDGDGTITSSLDRDLDLNQNLNIHDANYLNSLTNNQRQLINKVPSNDSFLYELTEYITDTNRPYSETLMERDGTGQLSTIYTYGNQRINSESYNNLSGLYTYDGRGSVSAVIGSYGDFRASYWYDGLGNVKSQIHGYGAFGSGKKYYGYNSEQYNPVTGNQNLRARQVNIRRQRFLTEDTYIGTKTNILSINRYTYAEGNPLKFKDPSGKSIIGPLEDLSNLVIGLLDKNIFKGGGKVAGYAQDKRGRINNIINKANVLSDYIQCASDNYGEATLNVLDAATLIAGGFAGFKTITDANKNKIVTTNYWTWQGGGGFADVYDDVFHAFTKTDHEKIYIGNEYTIWLWKGDYWNLGAGGEIGIYNGVGKSVSTTMSDRLGINISMEIVADDGTSIINIQNSNKYISSRDWGNTANPSEITKKVDSWWLTGWNPKVQGLTNNNLTLKGVLDFSDNAKSREIYKKLIDSKDNPNNNHESDIEDLGGYKIRITW